MGQRGPAPAPISLKVLKGTTRKDRDVTSPGPQDPPAKPDDIGEGAGKVWDRLLAVTDHIGEVHAETFRQFCETAAAANAMRPKGTKEWRELVNANRQLARELCLTPATGASLGRTKAPERKLDKYLAG